MTIRREELVAAASLGLLQYRQIDPLLLYLLHRDVRAQREALQAQARRAQRGGLHTVLSYMVVILTIVTTALFAPRMVQVMGVGALLFFALLYMLAALSLAAWCKRRGFSGRLHIFTALIVAAAPLAVFGLQQITG